MAAQRNPPEDPRHEQLTSFQLALFLLSVGLLVLLLVDTLAPLDEEVSSVLQGTDAVICGLFLMDWILRLVRSPDWCRFLRWGWIDLVACVPTVDWLRLGRLARIVQVVRVLRGVRVGHRVLGVLVRNKPRSTLASALLMLILMVSLSSAGILMAERTPGANIKTAEDAVWWSVSTITTVGYGDRYPVTSEGRIIAMILMLSGVGLFGMLSGLVASIVAGRQTVDAADLQAVLRRLHQLEDEAMARRPEPGGGDE